MKRLGIAVAVSAALANPAWADSFNMGLVNPIQTQHATYPGDMGNLYDIFNFSIASGSTVTVDFQGYPSSLTSLPPLDFGLRTDDWSYSVNWGSWSAPDFGSTGFVSRTLTGLTAGTAYILSVYGGGSLQMGSAGSYDVTLTIPTAPVPEPETYAMMLAGLGLLGLAARRRRQTLNS